MRFVDSHCHIDGERFADDRDDVIARAFDAGLVAMLNVGTGSPESDSFEDTVRLAESDERIFASVGIHPHDASEYCNEAEKKLKTLAASDRVIAWGEIGLDYHYDHSPRDMQRKVFKRQISVADDLRLPIIIQTRAANQDTLDILLDSCSKEDFAGGIMHCFGGTPDMALALMEIGFYISFAGNVTFKNADDLRESASVVPLDRLLIETDCPYLTPVPHRGKRNEPARVVDTARFLADHLGVPLPDLALSTTQNFFRFFNLQVPE